MGDDSARAPIQKGPVHQAIDDLVNRHDGAGQLLLNDLKDLSPVEDNQTTAYLEVLHKHLPSLPMKSLIYLCKTWYTPMPDSSVLPQPPYGFWPVQYHPTEPIVRIGMIKAMQLAMDTKLPLESYWVLGGERFETLVLQNTHQITRLIVTPPPPRPFSGDAYIANSADIWVIKRGQEEPYETRREMFGAFVMTQLNKTP